MQAEHSRGNGFIVSPLTSPLTASKPAKPVKKPAKNKKKYELITKEFFSSVTHDIVCQWPILKKRVLSVTLSAAVAICSVAAFCNFFTIGTAIYSKGEIIAVSNTENDYYNALSSAETYANEKNVTDFKTDFRIVPVLTFRHKISTADTLRDKLLTSSPLFESACTLYSGNTAIFNAKSEKTAKKIVSEYISSYSVDGEATTDAELTYKKRILPKDEISTVEECGLLLSQSNEVQVISVVNTSAEKEIPFETETMQDSSLYIGETVTVKEGKVGSAQVNSETVYKNGTQESSRILSENVVAEPVARVVRVGTKPKDVLSSGLLYPLTGTLSSPFGERWGRMHEGIDIAVPEGTPVKAAECGTVLFAGDAGTYGKLVRIDHGNGVVTAYAHLSEINVSAGQTVNSETQIALSGNTGRSTGPHLHFEIVKDGTPLEPNQYLKKR